MREKLIELLRKAKTAMKKENLSCDLAREYFIAESLIADGVTVPVRCKDCKHRENLLGEMCCPYYEDLPVEDNHFCAYGERRDAE